MSWFRRTILSDLEKESQRNHLLFFIMICCFLLGMAALLHYGYIFTHPQGTVYWGFSIPMMLVGIGLLFVKKAEHVYKYIMTSFLLAMSFVLMYAFNTTPAMFHMIYVTMVVAAIYFNGRLIWYLGSISIAFTIVAFSLWPELFFLYTKPKEMPNFVLYLLMITIALWGITRIGQTLLQGVNKERIESQMKAAELEKTQQLIDTTVRQLQSNFMILKGNVTTSSNTSHEIKQAFQEVAIGASTQAETMSKSVELLGTIEHSIDDLIQQITTASGSVGESLGVSKISVEKIQTFAESMNTMNQIVQESGRVIRDLSEQTTQINEIVEVITGIASQTSLLALNANIEAARAGEHGRGFTVVANEVLKLAEQSQSSAGRIQNILKEFSNKTLKVEQQVAKGESVQGECNQMLMDVLSNVNNLGEFIKSIDSLMKNIVDRQVEFQQNTSKIVQEVSHAASVTEQTSAATEQVLASVEEETTRIQHSVEALSSVDGEVNKLESILQK